MPIKPNLPPPPDDGLPTPKVGPWSANKHHFLRRYLDAFTTAMKGKPWEGLHYIDLFAGAGIENIDGKRLDWGSPLIAAHSKHPFSRLHLCEKSKSKFDALCARLRSIRQPHAPQVLCGDANKLVVDVVSQLPSKSLSIAFLDPHGLHLHFSTIRTLAARKVDLIVFFPDHLDALRNWDIYRSRRNPNLDLVLGDAPWRDKSRNARNDQLPTILCDLYIEQIKTLGYMHFDYERITRDDGAFLYRLIYCSRSPVGLKIWRGVSLRKPGGQNTFAFDS